MKHYFFMKNKLQTIYPRLGFFYRIARNRILGIQEPISIVLVVNNKCNWNCSYCFGDYGTRTDKDFTTEELKKIIDELYDLGCRYMVVHGGETLLRKDIGIIIDYLKEKGIYIGFVTNGSLLPQRMNDIRNVDSLCISLDGREEGNDKNRGPGTYKTALDAIKLAKKEGFRLRVHATLTRNTKEDIGYLAELAKKIGFLLEFSILYKPLKRQLNMVMDDDEIRNALKEIKEYKKKGYPIFTSSENLDCALKWPFSYSKGHATRQELPSDFRYIPCAYSKQKFIVDADGYVYPCFPLNEEFHALNLKEVGVKRAIEHVRKHNTCVACPHLTNNDYNLLFNLSLKQVSEQVKLNLHEVFAPKQN